MTEGDVALACARAFVGEFARSGMTDAAVSPGSRSTPIALAFARDARIRVHVHVDERAAGFFALGLAKASGRPVAVVTTSGTAAANLFPAIVEASMSRVPLLALTADRPPELRGTGANQTIDQVELFGRYVRAFVDAPVPVEGPDALRTWTLLAVDAYRSACRPGPVHVNLPFREPLVPAGVAVGLGGPVVLALPGVSVGEGPSAVDEDVDAFVAEIGAVERGLMVIGALRAPSRFVLDLAERLGWPAIAEPTSGLRLPGTLAAAQFLLSSERFANAHEPELVVQFGAAPTSRAALALVGTTRRLLIVDPDDLVADPHRRAERRFVVHAGQLAYGALERLNERPPGQGWIEAWTSADGRARSAVGATIDAWDEPYEGRVARDLAASLPNGSILVVGSSMPVRDLDAYMLPRDGLRVLGNRGASGIDGFVSTALGISATGVPTTALCGDLTLLHDAGSLLWSARRGHDCVFVVLNNDGGVIFSFLPQRDLPEFRELFTTPHGLDLEAVCGAAGASNVRIRRAGDLVPEVKRAREAGGVHVIEVPSDPDENVRRHAEVHAAVADALGRA
ncbi:MAG: 2-succinyl-5-enolpyruvyl-6-hydroxy-3-cyclohexene-1-carboxylic-acid synthase [Actinomycetota bacterium]